MKTYAIRSLPEVRLSGRFDPAQEGFPMLWTGACATLRVTGTTLDAQLSCDYTQYNPYLSFEVDGLKAQFFSPIKGTHWYSVFLGLEDRVHNVRITLETQAFSDDPTSCVTLLSLRTNGTFQSLPQPKCRLEFIGDSVTSGEGMRGPKDFMDWVPMMFSASSNYTRYAADALHADYQVVSQSGWGVRSSWDNEPANNLPDVYDYVCKPLAMDGKPNRGAEKPYAFDFKPDWVIVNLGSNDVSATKQPAWIDPTTGKSYQHDGSDKDMADFEHTCDAFLRQLHERNPQARLVWMFGIFESEAFMARIENAVRKAVAEGIPVQLLPLEDMSKLRGGIGSRQHPGEASHRMMARVLVQAIRKG